MIISDRLTCGSISGMIAATTKTLINYGFYLWGITKNNYPGLILEILLKAPGKTHSTGPFLLAMIIDSIIGLADATYGIRQLFSGVLSG